MTKIDKDTYKWFEKLFNNIGIGILIIDKNRNIIDINDYACHMFGYNHNELINRNVSLFHISIEKYRDFGRNVFQKVMNGSPIKKEWLFRKKNGQQFWAIITGNPIENRKEIIWTFTDITRNKIIEKKLKEKIEIIRILSITDDLTKLYNRRYFTKRFQEEIYRAKRDEKKFFLAILDIDNFKQYNDTYGHLEGDNIIKKVAKVLSAYTKRASDFAFRTGGDEFAIIATMKDDKNFIRYYFENIRKGVENLRIPHSKNEPYNIVTISTGVVRVSNYKNLDEKYIYQLADNELYLAKKNGRNRVEIKFKTL